MSYQALYRKYRSTNFEQIYGQEAIVKTLQNALKSNKIAHAYLFSGPRGTGKTSIARLFAKALNCEDGLGKICDKCSNCKEIALGISPDVIEIDAASNSGVDEVRNLIEKVKYAPTKSRYKVYIIDEVHMMSNSAFNALLKTLEEPPSYVVFILCTTELYKVLPTIVSRCQRYEFQKLSDEELTSLIKKVLLNEHVTYEEEAIKEIVELANGGARDALSILDQAISFSGNSIKLSDIESLFGLTSKKEKIMLLESIKKQDYQALLKTFSQLTEKNIDLVRFINEILTLLKDSLISKKTKIENSDMYVSLVSKYFDESQAQNLINVLLELLKEIKISNNPSLVVEIYLIKMIESINKPKEVTFETKVVQAKPTSQVDNKVIKETNTIPIVNKEVEKPKQVQPSVTTSLPKHDVNVTKVVQTSEPIKKDETPTQMMDAIDNLKPIFEDTPSTKSEPTIETSGEKYHLDIDSLIKLTVVSNKEAKKELLKRRKYLEVYKKDAKLKPYVELLLKGIPYLLCDTILVLMFNYSKDSNLANIKANQSRLVDCVEKILLKRVNIYALDRIEGTELITKYRNLDEVRKLPKAKEVNLDEIKF